MISCCPYFYGSSFFIHEIADLPFNKIRVFRHPCHGDLPWRMGKCQLTSGAHGLKFTYDFGGGLQYIAFLRRAIGSNGNLKSFHGLSIAQKWEKVKIKYLMFNIGKVDNIIIISCIF